MKNVTVNRLLLVSDHYQNKPEKKSPDSKQSVQNVKIAVINKIFNTMREVDFIINTTKNMHDYA